MLGLGGDNLNGKENEEDPGSGGNPSSVCESKHVGQIRDTTFVVKERPALVAPKKRWHTEKPIHFTCINDAIRGVAIR